MITFEGEEDSGSEIDPGPHYSTTLPSKTRGDKKSVEDIPLEALDPSEAEEIRDLLRPYSEMWQGHIGRIKETKHHIDLVPNARPQR